MPGILFAVFSDVHSNLEALQAVLADMEGQGVSNRVCLGDIVGYAADPAECLELVRSLGCSIIQGNHDQATATDMPLYGMRDMAKSGVEFARQKLSEEQRVFLARLPLTVASARCQFVHASLSYPDEWQYIVRESDAREHFEAQTKPLCFCGHTHVPTVWHLSNTGNIKSWRGHERIQLPAGGKTLVNVGSVGQPRDFCPDACYAICDADAEWIEFRRVSYDVRKAQRKILSAKLPPLIAERLSVGR